jgi:putative ABC transport system permease protein
MMRTILAALRAHPAPTLAIALLAAFAAGVAGILPLYLVGAVEVGTAAAVDSAPVNQRLVSVRKEAPGDVAPQTLGEAATEVRAALGRPGLSLVAGLSTEGKISRPGATDSDPSASLTTQLAYREGMCDHVRVTGSCPTGDRELLIHARHARNLGLDVGAGLTYLPAQGAPQTLRVVGVYDGANPDDPYWATGSLIRSEPVFVAPVAFTAMKVPELLVTVEGLITAELFSDIEPKATADDIVGGINRLQSGGYQIISSVSTLGDRVTYNRRLIVAGVPVAVVQMLLLCWFALGLAVRHASGAWRPDVGLLKLRGVPRGRLAAVVVGRSAVPVLAGAVVGAVAAVALGGPLRTLMGTPEAQPSLALSPSLLLGATLGAALITVLGSLAVTVAAERRMLGESVVDLLRQVPQRRAGWRAGVVEVVVGVLTVAALYQVRSVRVTDPVAAGLALFVPVLIALAVALTGTRLLVPIAAVLARRAFGGGRLTVGLAVLDLARRPGARRLAALTVVAVALLVTGAFGWSAAVTARADRAGIELGGERVLTVTAASSTHLLSAVRAADPAGRRAMAVIAGRAGSGPESVTALAVDTPRLAAVAGWPTGSGPGQGVAPAELAGQLRPPAADPIVVRGGAAELDVTVPSPPAAPTIVLTALLIDARGGQVAARFGPLAPGRPGSWPWPWCWRRGPVGCSGGRDERIGRGVPPGGAHLVGAAPRGAHRRHRTRPSGPHSGPGGPARAGPGPGRRPGTGCPPTGRARGRHRGGSGAAAGRRADEPARHGRPRRGADRAGDGQLGTGHDHRRGHPRRGRRGPAGSRRHDPGRTGGRGGPRRPGLRGGGRGRDGAVAAGGAGRVPARHPVHGRTRGRRGDLRGGRHPLAFSAILDAYYGYDSSKRP